MVGFLLTLICSLISACSQRNIICLGKVANWMKAISVCLKADFLSSCKKIVHRRTQFGIMFWNIFHLLCFLQSLATPSVVLRTTALISLGNFLEMHILGTFPDYWIRTLGFSNLCFNNPSRWLYMLNFDNNWPNISTLKVELWDLSKAKPSLELFHCRFLIAYRKSLPRPVPWRFPSIHFSYTAKTF